MRPLLLLAILLTGLAASADELANRVFVDIEDVAAAGKVEPVNGITSAGQPDQAALDVFASSGYAVVVDMRGPDEDRGIKDFEAAVESTGMDYVAFPIVDEKDISFETAKKLDRLLREAGGPVLIHCASGNRVGAVLALRESLAGANDDEAIRFGRDAGMTRLEPVVRKALQNRPAQEY
jgi:uncharacterized protein (TIGR01244 family)